MTLFISGGPFYAIIIWKWVQSVVETSAVTNIPTALAVFIVIIMVMLVFFFIISPKTKINHKKIANHFKHVRKNDNLMFWRFIVGKWLQMVLCYFIWANNWQAYQLRNIQNFTSLHFVISKLFFLFGWTLKVLLSADPVFKQILLHILMFITEPLRNRVILQSYHILRISVPERLPDLENCL